MAHTRALRGQRVGAWSCGLLAVALGLSWSLRAWPFLVDDAFIVARYAERLAQGAGYTFQEGAASDGVTGPLWLLPLAFGAWLGVGAVWAAKAFGLACSLGAGLLVAWFAAGRQGGRARTLWLALLLGTGAPLWTWAVGGLETGLAACLCTWLAIASLARPAPRGVQVGLAAFGLAWLRPELAPWVVFQLGVVVWRDRRAGLQAIGLGALGGLSVLAFRWLMFAHLLSLSAHAKPPQLANGVAYVFDSARGYGALVLLPWLALALARGATQVRLACWGLGVHAAAVALAGGDWMPGARLFVPLAPLVAWLVADQISALARRLPRLAFALGALVLLVRGESAWRETGAARAAGVLRAERLPVLLAALAPYPDPVVALDIGALAYIGQRRLIDLGGLTDSAVAYAPGGHVAKRVDPRWLEAQAPGAIVLHSRLPPRVDAARQLRWFAGFPVERWVLAQPWVLSRYHVAQVITYASDYYYVVLVKQ